MPSCPSSRFSRLGFGLLVRGFEGLWEREGVARWLSHHVFILSLPLLSFFSIFIIYRRFNFSENIFLLPRAYCILLDHFRSFNCWQSILVSSTHPLRATKLPKLSPGSLQRFTFSAPPALSSCIFHHHPLSNKEVHEVKWYFSGFLNLVQTQHPSRSKAQNMSVTALGGKSLNLPSRHAAGQAELVLLLRVP